MNLILNNCWKQFDILEVSSVLSTDEVHWPHPCLCPVFFSGTNLIPLLISEYLFPASKLVLEGGLGMDSLSASKNYWAKCTGKESRHAAYHLLAQLVVSSQQNLTVLVGHLVSLHHTLNPDILKEFQVHASIPHNIIFLRLSKLGLRCH